MFSVAMYLKALALLLSLQVSKAGSFDQWNLPGPSYENLPSKAVFPGPWDANIQAPANKTHIRPKRVWKTEGDVAAADTLVAWKTKIHGLTMGPGGLVTLEFPQNIAGRRVSFRVYNNRKC
jgi:hypothetical protein